LIWNFVLQHMKDVKKKGEEAKVAVRNVRRDGNVAFKKLKGDNKELLIIPGANHVDLYDQMSVIPFDKIERFFVENFK
jgi:hypothetical protein